MSMITCRECQSQISSMATTCPKCGCPVQAVPTPAANPQLATAPPVAPGLTVRPLGIAIGVILIAVGLWLCFVFIPAHDLSQAHVGQLAAGLVNDNAWYLKPDWVQKFTLIGYGMMALGVLQLATGSVKRTGWIAFCPKCNAQVIARKHGFGKRCERCNLAVK
jgi:hypothetical protein